MTTAERIDPLLLDASSAYDRESMRLHLERYEFAAPYVGGRTVVDCACGTGYGAELLARAGAARVAAVDISADALQFGREHHAHPRITYERGDAFMFQPHGTADVWVTLETVEHLDDAERYLRSVHARLAPHGVLVASVPTTVSTDGNPFHRRDFTARSWRSLVTDAGFSIEREQTQTHRFRLGDVMGAARGDRQQVRQNLLEYYVRHPGVAFSRLALTATKGLVNEYLVVAARRVGF